MGDKYIIIIGMLISGFSVFWYFMIPQFSLEIELLTKTNSIPIGLFGIPFFCGVGIIIIGIRHKGGNWFEIQYEVDRMMANEVEFVIGGVVVFFFGLLLIVSPIMDNLFTTFTGYKDEKLQEIAIVCLFSGAGVAIAAAVIAKKSA